jgi:hypothetical protein
MTSTSQKGNVHFYGYDRRLPAIWDTRYNTIAIPANSTGYLQQGMMTQLARRYPAVVKEYMARCEAGEAVMGKVMVIRPALSPKGIDQRLIQFFFCPIKAEKNDKPSIDALVSCLKDIVAIAATFNCNGIATGAMGCGSNPDFYLSWSEVGSAMLEQFSKLSIPVNVIMGKGDEVPTARPVLASEVVFTYEAWKSAIREVPEGASIKQVFAILLQQQEEDKAKLTKMLLEEGHCIEMVESVVEAEYAPIQQQ